MKLAFAINMTEHEMTVDLFKRAIYKKKVRPLEVIDVIDELMETHIAERTRRTVALALHPRLGENSPLSSLDTLKVVLDFI